MARIGFDIDGVIYRFTKAYHLWMNQSRGMQLDPELEADTWDWFTKWQTVEQFKLDLNDAVDAGVLYWEGELYESTISQNLKDIKSAGHTIHIVTARLFGVQKCPLKATEHFFNSQDLVFDTLTLSKDKTSVKTDVFLEDNINNYRQLEAAGITSYLVNRPYNLSDEADRRVDSVDEFTRLILEDKWQSLEYSAS